ncbi:MAG: hypothetical protein ACI8VE_000678 [Natrialbaceae archaeon]|jgi:hypothetical protein
MDGETPLVNRRELLQAVSVSTLGTTLTGCGSDDNQNALEHRNTTNETLETTGTPDQAHILESVRMDDEGFRVRRDGEWASLLVRGVNLGMGKPGRFPGETAITRDEYDRWLGQISAMNANVLRVYTVHPPEFYEALAEHNAKTDQPLYLLHGNWLPADRIEEDTTAFADGVTDCFDDRLRTVVNVVNGDAELPERAGYAGGTFEANVSNYTLGYIVGVEWQPRFVARTNERHDGGPTDGEFVRATTEAKAFERWLALRLDALAVYADETYGHRRPVSFANWPTTDHLSHPAEPFKWEDNASVNPNAVVTTDTFGPGTFATYHAYPYYPDFLNFSRTYTEYVDSDGEKSSYAGYLNDLVQANDHPVVIGEFGVPSSRGIAHEHVYEIDQGHHSETQQGEYDAELFERLVEAETAGGIVFAWQDEWFKRTWNTMKYTDPNRRPFWLNVQSPEERFGLLSFDPSSGITLTGDTEEWTDATTIATGGKTPSVRLEDGYDAGRSLREVRLDADEAFLYVRIGYDDLGDSVDWSRMRTLVALDITPDRGNTSLPRNLNVDSEQGVDFAVELAGPSASRVVVASHYDVFYYEYGHRDDVIDAAPYAAQPNNGVYHPVRLATSYPLRIPSQDRTIPFRFVETGELRYGDGDPTHSQDASLTDVHVDTTENTVEVRLPWQMLNFRDPSTRSIMGDIWNDGLGSDQHIDDIGIATMTFKPTADGDAEPISNPGNVTDSLPNFIESHSGFGEFPRYAWDTWQQPKYQERLKEGYSVLRETFDQY